MSNPQVQTVGTGASSTTAVFATSYVSRPGDQYADDMFDVRVKGNELRLEPRNALAAHLLHSWLAAEIRASAEFRAAGPDKPLLEYGAGMTAGIFTFRHRPILSKGGDPSYTGMVLSEEEAAIARAAVDQHRATKSAAASPKSRKRK